MFEDFRLKVFLTLADTHSFTKTASKLGVSQPAVSQNIAELEKYMGLPLFLRTKGEATLTDAGITFKEYAHKILYWYSAAASMFGDNGKMTSEVPMTISCNDFIASYILPSIIGNIRSSNPNANFEISDNSNGESEIIIKLIDRNYVLPENARFCGVVYACMISSEEKHLQINTIYDIPENIKLCVWEPYRTMISPEMYSKVSIFSQSVELIKKTVQNSSELLGIIPLQAASAEEKIIPFPLPHLKLDVIIITQTKNEFFVKLAELKIRQ